MNGRLKQSRRYILNNPTFAMSAGPNAIQSNLVSNNANIKRETFSESNVRKNIVEKYSMRSNYLTREMFDNKPSLRTRYMLVSLDDKLAITVDKHTDELYMREIDRKNIRQWLYWDSDSKKLGFHVEDDNDEDGYIEGIITSKSEEDIVEILRESGIKYDQGRAWYEIGGKEFVLSYKNTGDRHIEGICKCAGDYSRQFIQRFKLIKL